VTSGRAAVIEAIRRAVADLPLELAESIAAIIEAGAAGGIGAVQLAIQSAVPQNYYRALALELVEAWKAEAPELAGQSVALALITAARSEQHARRDQRLELVWTGPDVETVPPRRTEQVLLQVIDSADATLTIVSFVAYKVPLVAAAVASAARRGVAVRLILEDPDESQGKVAFGALSALGEDVAAKSEVYVWPAENRSKDSSGHHGYLHAKCAVADRRSLLISSANLTGYALNLNMELGVLVRGGDLPARVAKHWTALIESGILRRVLP
jgi:phosphatidylserine/phosphatidylglycerophosphate/cardiolipin synthase-like enzyme